MNNKPFLLKPAAKDYLWGGSRLNDDFGKKIPLSPLAETWECSTHPDGLSLVAGWDEIPEGKAVKDRTVKDTIIDGRTLKNNAEEAKTKEDCTLETVTVETDTLKAKSLKDVLIANPKLLGTHPLETTGGKPELPILIKLIDAKKDLSIQVHPDDEFALRVEGSLGKTEMWYVLDAKPGTSLIYGFKTDVEEGQVRSAIADGCIEKFLNFVPIHKNDLFYIEAGTVHAINAGALIVEIQESSNITYRLYDYVRVDKDGKQRPLHIDKALQVANLKSSVAPRQPMRVLKYCNGCASELLTRCKYFQVERLLLNTEVNRELVDFETGSNSFHALLVVDGCGTMSGNDYMLNFFKGDCIFVPADSIPLKLHGRAQILNVSC